MGAADVAKKEVTVVRIHGRGSLYKANLCNATSPLRRVKKPCAGYLGPALDVVADSSGKHSQEVALA